MEILYILGILAGMLLLWIDFLAIVALKRDKSLELIQKIAQIVFVILVPFIGASIVLRVISEYAPEIVSQMFIPWPFKKAIYAKPTKSNENRDHNEEIGD